MFYVILIIIMFYTKVYIRSPFKLKILNFMKIYFLQTLYENNFSLVDNYYNSIISRTNSVLQYLQKKQYVGRSPFKTCYVQ